MASIRWSVYLNLILGTLNVMLLVEIVFQMQHASNCTHVATGRITEYNYVNQRAVSESNPWPYIGSILIMENIENNEYDFACITVIVSMFHSLSASSCVDLIEDKIAMVRSGSSYWYEDGFLHNVTEMFNNDGDVAVINVRPGFLITQTIAVAGVNYNLMVGSFVNVTGWGETNHSRADADYPKRERNDLLNTVTVRVINSTTCTTLVTDFMVKMHRRIEKSFKIRQVEFCATVFNNGKDACIYKSGGLAVQNNVLVGLISFGEPVCGIIKCPGVYVNFGNFNKWFAKMGKTLDIQIEFVDN